MPAHRPPRPAPRPARLLAALALLPALAGCLPPDAARPTLLAQRDAAVRLAAAATADAAAVESLAAAILDASRERLLGSVERDIAARYLDHRGEPDLAALDADLHAAADNALTREVRDGRLTRDEAAALLTDYALASRMSDAGATRRELLARLRPLRDHDDRAAAALLALAQRRADVALLAREALASSDALLAAASVQGPALDDASRAAALDAWRVGVLAALPEGPRRDAAARAFDLLLGLVPPASPLARTTATETR